MSKTDNIFDMLDSLVKIAGLFYETNSNETKDSSNSCSRNEVSFKFNEKLEPEDKKKIVIEKLNRWTNLSNVFGKDIVVKFDFGNDEVFYFTWDEDYNGFVTEDPNGDKFVYDSKNETLNKIVNDEHVQENDHDELVNDVESSSENVDVPQKEKVNNFNLDDDENLASNLKNALRESFATKNDNKCSDLFCPFDAVEKFKHNVIDNVAYNTSFDADGNPIKITFGIECLLPENVNEKDDDRFDRLTKIYRNESANLDKFCELIKEKYNFSWVTWCADEYEKTIDSIEFILTF